MKSRDIRVRLNDRNRERLETLKTALGAQTYGEVIRAGLMLLWEREIQRYQPRCDATFQPLPEGPIVFCRLPAGHPGKHEPIIPGDSQ